MITKAVILSIDRNNNFCTVNMPLFQNASSTLPVKADALINIPPGMFNNLFEGDIVFVGFEENALEKPIILGKMYLGASTENKTPGGAGILDTLLVRSSAEVPASTTLYNFKSQAKDYSNFSTPKKVADYIKWLETLTKSYVDHLATNFRCFVKWVRWHFRPEHIWVDDGDIGDPTYSAEKYTTSDTRDGACIVCENENAKCTNLKKDKKCEYTDPKTSLNYSQLPK